MNNTIRLIVLGAAVIGMGLSMPSCPGQQALQQQVDALQTSNADLSKKVQALDATVKNANSELAQVKQVLGAMNGVIQSEKAAIEKLTADFAAMQGSRGGAKGKTPAKAPAKPAMKKRNR